jgi:ketosteroid isomerase-like protein
MANREVNVREKNLKSIHTFLNSLEQKDLDTWIDLWDENGQQINPYAPKGFPRILSGKNQYCITGVVFLMHMVG